MPNSREANVLFAKLTRDVNERQRLNEEITRTINQLVDMVLAKANFAVHQMCQQGIDFQHLKGADNVSCRGWIIVHESPTTISPTSGYMLVYDGESEFWVVERHLLETTIRLDEINGPIRRQNLEKPSALQSVWDIVRDLPDPP